MSKKVHSEKTNTSKNNIDSSSRQTRATSSFVTSSAHARSIEPRKQPRSRKRTKLAMAVLLIVIVAGALVFSQYRPHKLADIAVKTAAPKTATTATKTVSTAPAPTAKAVAPTPKPTTACSSNTLSQRILVSISARQMWACQDATVAYTSSVITGMENLPADLTPRGTFYISSKQTNLYLNGSDSTGSWHDYVYYWMPFLNNQYGTYGFHDATWRASDAFGNISPYSDQASHGCVEMPLTTSAWLYNWAHVGTAVTIQS